MLQPTLLEIPRINQDPRIRTAFNLYKSFESGPYIVHKTTRAGCTTALVAESINRTERFLCIVPTIAIATKTVVEDSKKYSDIENAKIINIPSNHECIKNKEMCERYPDLKHLPILPLPEKCDDCNEYEMCPVSLILRCPECDGSVLTYKKLAAIMLASGSRPNTQAERILDTLDSAKNLILDEIHELQFTDSTQLTVYNNVSGHQIDIGKYFSLDPEIFKYVNRTIRQFKLITDDKNIKSSIHNVLGGAESEDYWKHHLSISIPNPSKGIVDGEDAGKVMSAVYNEIIEIMKNRELLNLEIKDVLDIYKILSIVANKTVAIGAIKDNGVIKINLSAVDFIYSQMLKSYTMSMQTKDKRIMLTSATIGSYDYGSMFYGDEKIKRVTFGPGGDPMNTNSKMLILADTKRYGAIGQNALWKKRDEIINQCIKILDTWGNENCIIITLNRSYASTIEKDLVAMGHPHDVTYYKSPDMMGVTAKARVMIAIGIGYKPSNSFDVVTANADESKVLLQESIHSDTWQAWSRVKDPQSKRESVVFGIGCTVEDCNNLTTWGYGRTVEIEPYELRQKRKIHVNCERENITKPKIIKCKNFEMMLTEAAIHTHNKNVVTEINKKLPIYNIIGSLESKSVKISSKRDLLQSIINRNDVFAEQSVTGTYFKNEYPLNESLIESHLSGRSTFGAYQLNQASEVKWICFDIDSHGQKNGDETEKEKRDIQAENDKDRMCFFLDQNNIPYMLEASGSPHSYHVWIFVNPVKARIAKEFGKQIQKAVNIDCELFPKQCTINKSGYGNLVKLPFATNKKNGGKSRILVNGEFVDDFESIEIGVISIPEIKGEAEIKPVEPKIKVEHGDVRECIKNSVTMHLTGTQGHAMRIAICREYYNAGLHDPDELAKLFIHQSDYDFEFSRNQVLSIIGQELGNFRCSTLQDKCSNFIDCTKCKNKRF